MTPSFSPAGSIAAYAAICARLDDGFEVRAHVLRDAHLDEASWARLCAYWTEQLSDPSGAELEHAFVAAYLDARRALCTAHAPPEDASGGPRFLSPPQPWRTEAAAVLLSAPDGAPPPLEADELDHTIELTAHTLLSAALPFAPTSDAAGAPVAPTAAASRSVAPSAASSDPCDATLEAPAHSAHRPVLPFTKR